MLGKPITFVKNVGTGITDFFYEPTAGLLQASPQVDLYFYLLSVFYLDLPFFLEIVIRSFIRYVEPCGQNM